MCDVSFLHEECVAREESGEVLRHGELCPPFLGNAFVFK